jgi:mycothiol system anti-sigma-R factor
MNCRETLQEAYLYLDGEGLTEQRRREIRAHLEDCAPCYERVGLDHEVTAILAKLKGGTSCPEDLRVRITTLIERF